MVETRKLAAILAADVVGYSRLAGADEDRTLARLRALRSDLIDPTIAVHKGRVVKRTGDGALVEFRSVVDAVRCAIEVQNDMVERNAGLPEDRRIEFRIGIHLGDVVEESDGDLMGDGVNIAARLEGIAEPNGICLSGAAYEQVRDKLKERFADLGDKELKNIARPVRVYAVRTAPGTAALDFPISDKRGPPRHSIVVLPFANFGDAPGQEHFVDGVTESLTTDLSRIRGSFVIARNTAFTYKGKPFDVKQIGRELKVRYVVEGSIQRGGDRMRVNVQLIDAEHGNHLWAERFDRPVADLFDLQDEIVARLANALNAQLISAEARRAERTPNPESMDLWYQGMAWYNKGVNPEFIAKESELYQRALALDPTNVDALAWTGIADVTLAIAGFTVDRAARLASAESTLTKALSLAPEHALAHQGMALLLSFTNRAEQGIAECERALALDRNLAAAHAHIGLWKAFVGRSEETEAHVREALRLSPRDPWAYSWMHMAGTALLLLGRPNDATAWLRRSIEANRNFPNSHFFLAAALAHLDRLEEARSEVANGLALNPRFTIAGHRAGIVSADPAYLSQREYGYDGMRKAGVPQE
ncbi:MAG: adenylate/guanylate cyclase domain-containing protein [Roseiarcus sp.]|jgi:TolB-like protein